MEAVKLLTPRQVADLLQVREQTLATWRCNARHDLPFVRIGRAIRYRPEDVEKWLASRTVGTTTAVE